MQAVADHVADDQGDPGAGERDDVEPVAADARVRGQVAVGGVDGVLLGQAARQQALLQGDGHRVAAGDRGGDLLLGGVLRLEHAVVPAEPQHRDPVGDGLHVVQVVADDDDRVALFAQPADQVEGLRALFQAEGGGRLVEHHQLGVADQRAGDGDGLPLAAGERQHGDAQARQPHREALQQGARAPLHLDLAERSEAAQLAAEVEVGDHVEALAEREVLVDGGDAELLGVAGPAQLHPAALPLDHAGVRGAHPGDGLDQGGLAGAVVADQGDHLAVGDLQVHAAERLQRAVPLGDPAQRQQRHAGHPATSPRPRSVGWWHESAAWPGPGVSPTRGDRPSGPARYRISCPVRPAVGRPGRCRAVGPIGVPGHRTAGSAEVVARVAERLLHSLPWRT